MPGSHARSSPKAKEHARHDGVSTECIVPPDDESIRRVRGIESQHFVDVNAEALGETKEPKVIEGERGREKEEEAKGKHGQNGVVEC